MTDSNLKSELKNFVDRACQIKDHMKCDELKISITIKNGNDPRVIMYHQNNTEYNFTPDPSKFDEWQVMELKKVQ